MTQSRGGAVILDEVEMIRWGRSIGAAVRTPLFLFLIGPLGAGKSVLARSIAHGAGVEGAVPSPTFNLMFRYRSDRGVQVVHMDLYRLSEPDELWELGWQELGSDDELILVEWPERAKGMLPEHRWEITLAADPGNRRVRSVSVNRVGAPYDLPGFPISVSL
jgi:tRNA threonylcarbamoyladenosine biosynthesis protein TsaE